MARSTPLSARGAARRCVLVALAALLAAGCEGDAPAAPPAPASPLCNPACPEGELCVALGPGRTACVSTDVLACPDGACEPAPPAPACAEPCAEGETCDGGVCVPQGLGCRELDACVAACAARPACALLCRQQARWSAAQKYDALVACGQEAGCDSWSCVAGACPEAWKACLGDGP